MRDRLPGLDGLRAVAVAAVLAFHAGVAGVGGGLLGVDLFLVVSGYLITSLLLRERDRTGTVSLSAFWVRRARRLIPALLVTLTGVALASRWLPIVPAAQLRGDLLAAVYYGSNWHYVIAGQSYFSAFGSPSPLLHLWSLAVEEQFYLVWPLVAVVALRWWGRRGLGVFAGVGALASAGWAAFLFLDGAGLNRVYYGTDTRAQSLLVGCVLACLLGAPASAARVRSRTALGWAGLAGAAALLWCFHAVGGTGGFLYQGGFLLVALSGALVIAALVGTDQGPGAVLGRVLSLSPLRYVGRISYGLYLYHWPLFQVLDQSRTGLSGSRLLVFRLAATLAVAALSFHVVEEPIRSGSWRTGWARWRQAMVASSAGILAFGGILASATPPAAAEAAPSARSAVAALAVPASTATPPSMPPATTVGPTRPGGPPPTAGTTSTSAPAPALVHALLIGDSMAVTLAPGLSTDSAAWGVAIDDEAALGCDLDPATTVDINGGPGPAGQGCADWATHWQSLVDRLNPDVVAVELGRFETANRLYNGSWTSAGQAAFDAHLRAEMLRVVDVLSSRGARVVLLTLPYVVQTTDQPNGSPWPINDPSRTEAWNALLRQVAAERPGAASVVDLNQVFDPEGRYADVVDGLAVRDADREHFSKVGGMVARPTVLPALAQLGRQHAELKLSG